MSIQVSETTQLEALPSAPKRKPGQWVAVAVVLVLAAMIANTVLTNERFHWDIVFSWFTSTRILTGLGNTLQLTVVAMAIGIALGLILALMRLSANRFLVTMAWLYSWFFRGTPVFVQLLFWGSIAALYPQLSIGVPFGPEMVRFSTNSLISPYVAAILGLALNQGACMGEIFRGGIRHVDRGQTEAAMALGMGRGTTMRRIILPQAMRVIIPPMGNELIGLLKDSSLVAVLAYSELLYSAQLIYAVNYQTIPLLLTAALWYLLVTSLLNIGQFFVERHLRRSDGGEETKEQS